MTRASVHPLRGSALALCASALLACTQRNAPPPAQAQTTFAVQGEAASAYRSEPSDAPALRGPHAELVARGVEIAAATKSMSLVPDGRLGQLAEWIARGLDGNGSPPPYPVIELWARHLGLPEPTPHLIVLLQPDTNGLQERTAKEVASLLAQQRYTHFGAAAFEHDGNLVAVTVLSWRWLHMDPVPRVVAPGDKLVLHGRIDDDLSDPQLVLTEPNGTSRRLDAQSGREFRGEVSAPQGELRVELLAKSALGTTVVANFPVYAGVTPPTEVAVALPGAPGPALSEDQVIKRLLALMNEDRTHAGREPVALDDALSQIALAHSQDMHDHGFVGHTSPTTGSAKDRIERAGVRTTVVLENIGRGYSPDEVHRGLMDSPGHRANVLSPDVTHVGIGVVRESEDERAAYLVTEVYVRRAAKIDVDDAPDQLLEVINAERERRGMRALVQDESMAALANGTARQFFASRDSSRQQLVEALNRKAAARPSRYTRIAALLTVVSMLSEARGIEPLLEPQARAVGFGVAQGTRPDTVPDAIAIVALLAY
jgi:uncharacterized protein YkwD